MGEPVTAVVVVLGTKGVFEETFSTSVELFFVETFATFSSRLGENRGFSLEKFFAGAVLGFWALVLLSHSLSFFFFLNELRNLSRKD